MTAATQKSSISAKRLRNSAGGGSVSLDCVPTAPLITIVPFWPAREPTSIAAAASKNDVPAFSVTSPPSP